MSVWRHASALLLLPPLRRYDHLSLRVHSFRAGEWVLQWEARNKHVSLFVASAYLSFVSGMHFLLVGQEWNIVPIFQQVHYSTEVLQDRKIAAIFQHSRFTSSTPVCKLRPGSSTNSEIDQCACRVGTIQINGKLHSAASGRRATRGGDWECIVGSTHGRLRWFLILNSENIQVHLQ